VKRALLVGCLLLGACGKPLGSYTIDKATLVPRAEFERIEPISDLLPDEQFIRIDFSSTTDVVTTAEGDLYVHGDFCPMGKTNRLSVFGPYPDGQERYTVDGDRRPVRDAAGRYHYVAYLRTSADSDPAYDLRSATRDLCFRVDATGYNLTPSESKIFTLPAQTVARLVGRG
jgi:hypothetical protein